MKIVTSPLVLFALAPDVVTFAQAQTGIGYILSGVGRVVAL
jgi:hypothetical protein